MFSIDQLLAPVSEDSPCGEDLAFSPELDAIARARVADDPSIEQGAWVTTLKEADFKFVATRCASLIESRSKDLRLAVWLAEASAKTGGLRALGDSLMVIAGLCERYWGALFPLADDDGHEQRIGNLRWIAARMPALAHAIALTEAEGYSLNDFQSARNRVAGDGEPDLEAAKRRGSRAFYQALMDDARYCVQALDELERVVDVRLETDGPSFSAAREGLQDVIFFIAPQLPEAGLEAGAVTPSCAAPAAIGPIQSRAHALAQLRLVAEFFRRTEPHSPVAYLAEKAAGWGEQTLDVWLRGVVKDPSAIAQLEELLGLQSN